MRLVEELFPRTIVMDEGLIVADGNTREILQNEKFLNEHGLKNP
jgi:energy-coupling factor transporter ATP-binding protein EcfA2